MQQHFTVITELFRCCDGKIVCYSGNEAVWMPPIVFPSPVGNIGCVILIMLYIRGN